MFDFEKIENYNGKNGEWKIFNEFRYSIEAYTLISFYLAKKTALEFINIEVYLHGFVKRVCENDVLHRFV